MIRVATMMINKIKRQLLLMQSGIFYKALALVSIAGFVASCGVNKKQACQTNQDSLISNKEIPQTDVNGPIYSDSLSQVNIDSILILQQDTQTKVIIQPRPITITPCYGAPSVILPNPSVHFD